MSFFVFVRGRKRKRKRVFFFRSTFLSFFCFFFRFLSPFFLRSSLFSFPPISFSRSHRFSSSSSSSPPSKPLQTNKQKLRKKNYSYIEKYVPADADPQALREHPATALAPLVHVALALSDVAKLTGRKEPTVIT